MGKINNSSVKVAPFLK